LITPPRTSKRFRTTRFLLLLATLFAPAAAAAQEPSTVRVDSLHVDLVLGGTGVMRVTETMFLITREPEPRVRRTIPTRYTIADGRTFEMWVHVHSARVDGGEPVMPWSLSSRTSERADVQLPASADTLRTLVLEYIVDTPLRPAEGASGGARDALVWTLTDTAYLADIRRVTARLVLPDAVHDWESTARLGNGEAALPLLVEVTDNSAHLHHEGPLASGEPITLIAAWPVGLVAYQQRTPYGSGGGGSLAMLALVIIGFFLPLALPFLSLAYVVVRRRPPGGANHGPPTPAFEPPAGMTPADAGTLVDGRTDMHDVLATIIDLGVRGYVGIEEQTPEWATDLPTGNFALHLLRSPQQWTQLQEHERMLLLSLFNDEDWTRQFASFSQIRERNRAYGAGKREAQREGRAFDSALSYAQLFEKHSLDRGLAAGAVARVSDLTTNSFPMKVAILQQVVRHRLRERGFYQGAVRLGGGRFGVGGALALLGVVLLYPLPFHGVSLLVSAAIVGAFGNPAALRTREGLRAAAAVEGFKLFLGGADRPDVRERLTQAPEMFERYLPYAFALGVAPAWAAAFDGIDAGPPSWYRGSVLARFSTSDLVRDLARLFEYTVQTESAGGPRTTRARIK
jgi:hypothetical protein